jgi:flagellar basal-body rod modification protein FlgD
MTTINGTPYVAPTSYLGTNGYVSSAATGMGTLTGQNTRNTGATAFDKDTFLKLLVAQLKYQDPSHPADSGQLMQQTSSLSMVESTNQMAKEISAMVNTYTSMLAEQRMASGVALVGHNVSYLDPSDATKTLQGVVDSVKFDATGPILSVGGKDVPLSSVSAVVRSS